ncbi:MAG: NAD-dependent epimerase/dehydratase family protein [Bacteroidetes bacterium]|nr:MAG: NAD-dependent epimerase/dehydratase family protein [Bacteroidota bacterium]
MSQKNTLLITGASGFTGGRLTEYLLAQYPDAEILATSRNAKAFRHHGKERVQFQAADLRDKAATEALFVHKPRCVVHCAALSAPWGKKADFYEANVVATRHIADACLAHGVQRLVHISTPSIYFEFRDKYDIRESDPLPDTFINEYAATKYEAELMLAEYMRKGLEIILLRPRAIIGAGDTVIFPRLIQAHEAGRLRVIGSGNNIVDVTSVSNVCEAVRCALEAPAAACGEAYNITNGEPVALWDLIGETFSQLGLQLNRRRLPYGLAMGLAGLSETLASFTQKEPSLTRYGVGILAFSCTLDISKARERLGYSPLQNNADTVHEFVSWKNAKL